MFDQKSHRVVYENQWIRLHEDEVVFPNGEAGTYTYVDRVDAGPMIIPVSDDGRLIVLREWRYPIQGWTYCFPFGGKEHGESCEDAARRELLEETGYEAGELILLGEVHSDPGFSSQRTPVYLARKLEQKETARDQAEIQEVCYYTCDEIERDIREGKITNGWLLAGYTKYRLFLKQNHIKKRLYRSKEERMLAGICGGVAEYFDTDPTIVRLLFAFGVLITGVVPLIIVYILGAFIIPEKPDSSPSPSNQ